MIQESRQVQPAILAEFKEAMSRLLKETTEELALSMKNITSDSLTETRALTRQTKNIVCLRCLCPY
ncbi:TPA: hypothetical protein JBA25_16055 [Legionella pneumophila]|nr:hypothetical protein [Legionella pneumophila]